MTQSPQRSPAPLAGSPAGHPYMSHPDITSGRREGKWCVVVASKHPTRGNNALVQQVHLSERIRANRHAPITRTGDTSMRKNTSTRSTRKVWQTVKLALTSEQFGLLTLELDTAPTADVRVGRADSRTLTATLPYATQACHLCKVSNIDTVLTEGEAVVIWQDGKRSDTRVSGIACEGSHWDKSAKVAAPKATPAPKAPKAPKAAAPKAAPATRTPAPKPATRPSDMDALLKSAKAVGAAAVVIF